MIKRWLRGLNTHFICNFGSGLASFGLSLQVALQYPGATSALKLVGVPDHTVTTISAGSLIAIAIGAALNRYGRPETVPAGDATQPPPAPPAKGNSP